MENPKFNFQPIVLASNQDDIRYKGSSGGVITHIIKYLFETNKINSAIGFKFTGIELFKACLITSLDEYKHTGSIYHEVNIYKFLKDNLKEIKSPIMISCLPCQIIPIKRLMNNHKIETVIISLVCSAQLEKEATYYFLEKNNIDMSKVKEFRYRGNGWPSGIQIKTDEKEYFFHNNNSKWLDVFHSQIFTLDRCFSCVDTFGLEADISIADPWLERYIKNDKIGSSIVLPHTTKGNSIIKKMIKEKELLCIENLTQSEVLSSQEGTLVKKFLYSKYKKQVKFLKTIFTNKYYKDKYLIFSRIHIWLLVKLIAIMKRIEGINK